MGFVLLSSVFVQLQEVTLERAEESHLKARDGTKAGSKIGILISILDPFPSQDEGSKGRHFSNPYHRL
jgi:hypothetical protein